jgi:hypothetical protein
VLVAVCLYLIVGSVIDARLNDGIRTTGTVVRDEKVRVGRSAFEHRYTVRYQAGGRLINVRVMSVSFFPEEYPTGSSVDVFYEAESPEAMAMKGSYGSEGMWLLVPRAFGMIGVCFLMVGFINYLLSTR